MEHCCRISSYFSFVCLNYGFFGALFLLVAFPLLFFLTEEGCRRNRDSLKLPLEKGGFVVTIQFPWCSIDIAIYLIETETECTSWINAFLRLIYFSLKVSRHLLCSPFSCEQRHDQLLHIISPLFAVLCSLSWLPQSPLCHEYFNNLLLGSLFAAD